MTMASKSPVTWTVTTQSEGQQRMPDGTFAAGVSVGFKLSTGQAGTVFLPHNLFTPDNVRDAVQARAELLQRVAGLSGEAKA